MPWRRETRHVDADLGHDDPGKLGRDTRDGLEELYGISKRDQRLVDLLLEANELRLQIIVGVEVELEHESRVCVGATAECVQKLTTGRLDSTAHESGELLGVGFTGDDTSDDRKTAHAGNVGQHRVELYVAPLQDLLHALHLPRPLLGELPVSAHEVA